MKKVSCSERLNLIIAKSGLKSSELLRKTETICKRLGMKNIIKSEISNYRSGKAEPTQKKLSVLAEALGTNEVWLMGYDVPMEPNMKNVSIKDVNRDDIDAVLGIYYDILTDTDIQVIKTIIEGRLKENEKN